MNKIKRRLLILAFLFIIPVAGSLLSGYFTRNAEDVFYRAATAQFQRTRFEIASAGVTPGSECRQPAKNAGIRGFCESYAQVEWLWTFCRYTIIVGIALLLLIRLAVNLAARGPSVAARFFPLTAGSGLLLLAASTALQTGVVCYGVFLVQFQMFQRYDVGITEGAGMIGLIVSAAAVSLLILMLKKPGVLVAGLELDPAAHPRLFEMLRAVETLGAGGRVDQVIIGGGRSCFVTAGAVRIPGCSRTFLGMTLVLSLPLLTRLTPGELKVLLARDLALLKGPCPADRWLQAERLIAELTFRRDGAGDDIRKVVFFPARLILEECRDVFAREMEAVIAAREREADRLTAALTSPEDLAGALVKATLICCRMENAGPELKKSLNVILASRLFSVEGRCLGLEERLRQLGAGASRVGVDRGMPAALAAAGLLDGVGPIEQALAEARSAGDSGEDFASTSLTQSGQEIRSIYV